jgi:hypothetical protein
MHDIRTIKAEKRAFWKLPAWSPDTRDLIGVPHGRLVAGTLIWPFSVSDPVGSRATRKVVACSSGPKTDSGKFAIHGLAGSQGA